MYSSTALQQLPTSIFGEQFYFVGGLLIFLFLLSSFYILLHHIAIYVLQGKLAKGTWIAFASFMSVLAVVFTYSYQEAIFWFSASASYTISFAAQLVLIALLIKLFCVSSKTKARQAGRVVGIALLAFYLMGHNISPSLGALYIVFVAFAVSIYRLCKDKHNKTILIAMTVILLVSIAGITFSITAPGNYVRTHLWEAEGWLGRDLLGALTYNFFEIIYLFLTINSMPIVLCELLLAACIARKIGKLFKSTSLKHLSIVSIALAGLWYAVVFPFSYLNITELAGRSLNYLFFVSMALNLVWLTLVFSVVYSYILSKSCNNKQASWAIAAVLVSVSVLVVVSNYTIQRITDRPTVLSLTNKLYNGDYVVSDYFKLLWHIQSGEVQQAARGFDDNYFGPAQANYGAELIIQCNVSRPVTVFDDLAPTWDGDNARGKTSWQNTGFAAYYHLKSAECSVPENSENYRDYHLVL